MNKKPRGELIPGDIVDYVVGQLDKKIDIAPSQLSQALMDLPAPGHELDDPLATATLNGLFDQLRSAAEHTGAALLDRLLLSSLPSGSINAFCADNTWDEFNYIFVDSEVLSLCNMAAKILITCMLRMADKDGNLTNLDP